MFETAFATKKSNTPYHTTPNLPSTTLLRSNKISRSCASNGCSAIWGCSGPPVPTPAPTWTRKSNQKLSKWWPQPISTSQHPYDFQTKPIFSLLPHKIAEENDGKVIVGSDETTKQAHELNIRGDYENGQTEHIDSVRSSRINNFPLRKSAVALLWIEH